MVESLLASDVSIEQCKQLEVCTDPDKVKDLLAEFLGLREAAQTLGNRADDHGVAADDAVEEEGEGKDGGGGGGGGGGEGKDGEAAAGDPGEEMRFGILVDYYFYAVAFARGAQFSPQKTSVLLSVLRRLLEHDMKSSLTSPADSFRLLKQLMLLHSCERPPWSSGVYTLDDVAKITDYVVENYYRHLKLYKYVFTAEDRMDIRQVGVCGVEDVPALPPLSQAVPEEQWLEQKESERQAQAAEDARAAAAAAEAARLEALRNFQDPRAAMTDEDNAAVDALVAEKVAEAQAKLAAEEEAAEAAFQSKKAELEAQLAELGAAQGKKK